MGEQRVLFVWKKSCCPSSPVPPEEHIYNLTYGFSRLKRTPDFQSALGFSGVTVEPEHRQQTNIITLNLTHFGDLSRVDLINALLRLFRQESIWCDNLKHMRVHRSFRSIQ